MSPILWLALKPIRWHRTGFKVYWKWLSRKHAVVGRKPTSQELRELIFRMVAENRTCGAPRFHGELRMLGFDISERTVLRWMRKTPRDTEPAQRWAAFLNNHREARFPVAQRCSEVPARGKTG